MALRLAILGSSPCDCCTAQCCRQTVSEYAVLLQGDEARRLAAWSVWLDVADDAGVVRSERVIPYRDGRCPFLGDDDRCTIYEDRPAACRAFECVTHYNRFGVGRHGYFVARNAAVRDLLTQL